MNWRNLTTLADFISIPAIFYVVVAAAHLDIQKLRDSGWIFDMGGSSETWYKFYSYFSELDFDTTVVLTRV